jgi:presenilin-like A22 family membrane protease
MFLVAQFIGLYVVNYYSPADTVLPFGLEPPQPETPGDYTTFFSAIIIAFMIAVLILLLFTKLNLNFLLKAWFFVVIVIALSISFIAIFSEFISTNITLFAVGVALLFAIIKISGKSFIVHNFTELLIYPGIAAVFVPILNIWTVMGLLILISIYDVWAVWHSGIMQKMARYQIDHLKIFTGFFVPFVSKKVRSKIKTWKKTLKKSELRKKKIRVNVAILGGGDIVFPIIASGVMLKTLGIWPALLVILGAFCGLGYLFFAAEKKKFYPAMPFITAGILVGIGLSYLVF